MTALMAALMAFILSASNLPPIGADYPPQVEYMTAQEMWETVYPDAPYDPDNSVKVEALYNHNIGTIGLHEDFDPSDILDVSKLLHELVHHLQWEGGLFEEAQCLAELETDAYELQFAFLRAAGLDPFEALKINSMMLALVTQCQYNHG